MHTKMKSYKDVVFLDVSYDCKSVWQNTKNTWNSKAVFTEIWTLNCISGGSVHWNHPNTNLFICSHVNLIFLSPDPRHWDKINTSWLFVLVGTRKFSTRLSGSLCRRSQCSQPKQAKVRMLQRVSVRPKKYIYLYVLCILCMYKYITEPLIVCFFILFITFSHNMQDSDTKN